MLPVDESNISVQFSVSFLSYTALYVLVPPGQCMSVCEATSRDSSPSAVSLLESRFSRRRHHVSHRASSARPGDPMNVWWMNTDQVLSEQKTTPTNRQTFNNNIHKRVLSMGATGVTVKAMKNTYPLPPTGKKHQRTNLSFIYSLIYSPPGNHSLKHYPALLNDLETHSFVQKPVMLNYTDAPERPLASRRRKDIIELRKYRRQKKNLIAR